jgi:hypothetical protein
MGNSFEMNGRLGVWVSIAFYITGTYFAGRFRKATETNAMFSRFRLLFFA